MSDTPQKLCTGTCGRLLPATKEFFYVYYRRDRGVWEMKTQCKTCVNKVNDEGKKRRKKESLNHVSNGHSPVTPSIDKLTVLKPRGTPDRCGSCGTERGNILGDVDEITGKGYGYLCMNCYRLVSAFHGNPERMRTVLSYIERTRGTRKKKPSASLS